MSERVTSLVRTYVEISDRLGTGGQPKHVAFAALAAAGYQVVINLAMPHSEEAVPNEDWLVTEQGMSYVHLPVPWEKPTRAHLVQFFALMDAFQLERVFVHCIMNMRVAVFVYLYRVCRLMEDPDVARAAMLSIWQPYDAWQSLIETALNDPGLCQLGAL
jgi:protein tyrosine phosphatase (PTP) superfamily phosphohydrolase (DUF442 family)